MKKTTRLSIAVLIVLSLSNYVLSDYLPFGGGGGGGGGSGTVTNIATTAPIGGGPITTTGTLTCTTCTTSASALTSNAILKGAGGQAMTVSALTDDGAGNIGVYPASGTPTATTLTYSACVGTDIAGANDTIKLSGSTGAGVGGTLAFQNTNKAGTGTTANTFANVLTLSPPNTGTTAPVDYLDIKNAITGGGPALSAVGSDTNIPLLLSFKGQSNIRVLEGSGVNNTSFAPSIAGQTSTQSGFNVDTSGFAMIIASVQAALVSGSNDNVTRSDWRFAWSSTTNPASPHDLFLSRRAAATLQLGVADAASPVAQTLAVQGSRGGTDSNVAGAAMIVQASLGTGNSVPATYAVNAGAVSATSGTTQQASIPREILNASKVLTNNTTTTVANITDASNTSAAGYVAYACEVFNGTDVQWEQGSSSYGINNKGGVFTQNTTLKYGNQQGMTTGTLTVTWTITAANPALLQLNANSSLTPSAGYPRCTYELHNLTQQAVAIQ